MTGEIDLPEICGDSSYTLEVLYRMIPELQKKYGKNAIISFDASHNNVEVKIVPTKKIKNVP